MFEGPIEETTQQTEKEWSVTGELGDKGSLDFWKGESFRRKRVDSNFNFPRYVM